MHQQLILFVVTVGWFSTQTIAQSAPTADTVIHALSPVFIQTTLLGSSIHIGGQVGLGMLLSETEAHRIRKSGREKIIFRERAVSLTPGFYYQKYLHTNLFLTADYAFVRRHKSGFYRKFAPFVGISRTFLNATTYTVDDNGTVHQDKTAGDWRAMAGFTWGIGKRFNSPKSGALRDLFLTLNVPFFYPNFRSVALKPSLQIGVAFNLNHVRHPILKTIKTSRP